MANVAECGIYSTAMADQSGKLSIRAASASDLQPGRTLQARGIWAMLGIGEWFP
jgi:hypothetical protein